MLKLLARIEQRVILTALTHVLPTRMLQPQQCPC